MTGVQTCALPIYNENSNENIFTIPLDKNLYAAQFWYLFRSRHYNHGGALGGSSENGTSANISTVLANGYGTDDVDACFEKNFYAGIVEVDGKPVMMDNGQQLEDVYKRQGKDFSNRSDNYCP